MTKAIDHKKTKLLKYYWDGYEKGRDDALRGVKMKLLQKTKSLRSKYLKEWERGYQDGYLAVKTSPASSLTINSTLLLPG